MASKARLRRKRRARRNAAPTVKQAKAIAAAKVYGFSRLTPEIQNRYVSHFRKYDTSKQSPTKPAYVVPFNQKNTKNPVRSNSLGKRYFARMFRGRLAAPCADRPDPKHAGEVRQKQRREQERFGTGRQPKAEQAIRRARSFRVWCQ